MMAAGKTIGQVCQTLEVSEQTYERWQKKYGGLQAEEAKRLRELWKSRTHVSRRWWRS